MKKSVLSATTLTALAALSFAGCASAPTSGSSASAGASDTGSATDTSSGMSSGDASSTASGSTGTVIKNFKACMVSDLGGFDDKSFNQTSLAGLTKAGTELGITVAKVQSQSDNDYATNVNSLVKANCNMIVGVGYKLADAVTAAAKANPKIDFALVDASPTTALSNVQSLEFNTAQSSFEAGYLAAAMSTSGKVGTFGGMKIPTVTVFMDGFAQGVAYYNQQKGKSVQVLGWDATKQDGQFVPGSNPFSDLAGGKNVASSLISQGADIIFPVAGGSGIGALQAVQANSSKVSAIWVDTDGYVSNPTYKSIMLSSVYKAMDVAVYNSVKAAATGQFTNKAYVGTLANQGTGLASFHDFDSKVSSSIKSDLTQIQSDIASGKIKITSTAQPK